MSIDECPSEAGGLREMKVRLILVRVVIAIFASTVLLLGGHTDVAMRAAESSQVEDSPSVGPDAHAIADAQSLRADFGLASDEATVVGSFTNQQYVVGILGIPTTLSEEALVETRLAHQQALLPVAARASSNPFFAGAYFDADHLTIATTSIEATSQGIAELLPDDGSVTFETVSHSAKELDQIRASIVDAAAASATSDFALKSVAVDPRRNEVVVGVSSGLDNASEYYATRYSKGTVAVHFEELGEGGVLTCTEDDCGTKGGLTIRHTTSIGSVTCTSGFLVKRDSSTTRYILTAGHCLAPFGGINSSVPWKNGSGTTTWGTSLNYQYNSSSVFVDQGVIGVGSVAPSAWNQYYTGSAVVASITGELTWAQQVAGITVCRYGITTNWGCGTLVRPDLYIKLSGGTVLNHTFEVRHRSDHGDSGAGYIYNTQYGTYHAVGILSSGDNRSGVDYTYYWPTVYSINGPAGLFITSPCITSLC